LKNSEGKEKNMKKKKFEKALNHCGLKRSPSENSTWL
jgi:hypothetical protein